MNEWWKMRFKRVQNLILVIVTDVQYHWALYWTGRRGTQWTINNIHALRLCAASYFLLLLLFFCCIYKHTQKLEKNSTIYEDTVKIEIQDPTGQTRLALIASNKFLITTFRRTHSHFVSDTEFFFWWQVSAWSHTMPHRQSWHLNKCPTLPSRLFALQIQMYEFSICFSNFGFYHTENH